VGGGNLNLLIALHALLEEGNVTRAGDRLGMSQPAMSAALSRLRRHYGDELLIRVGREVELTPLARALRSQVEQTIPLLERSFMLDRGFESESSDRSFRITLSDYAMSVVHPPLRARLARDAPNVRLDYCPLPPDAHARETALLAFDCMVSPRGFGFKGDSVDLFHDTFVCIADPANPWLDDGRLSLDAVAEMPHVRSIFGVTHVTPVDRHLAELGIDRRIEVTVRGWLAQPFVVAGSPMLGVIPRRLAERIAPALGVLVIEPPFGEIRLTEALWWHPTRLQDAGNRWLRAVIQQVAEELDHNGGGWMARETSMEGSPTFS
jgi:DNA-binding transcriptional LysR family regulator